jgi:hypothetical protein
MESQRGCPYLIDVGHTQRTRPASLTRYLKGAPISV